MTDYNFPFYQLPENARRLVLSSMDIIELLSFSLCSTAANDILLAFNLNFNVHLSQFLIGYAPSVAITFRNGYRLNVRLYSQRASNWVEGNKLMNDFKTYSLFVEYGDADVEGFIDNEQVIRCGWKVPYFALRDWAIYFVNIFGHKYHEITFLLGSQQYDPQYIKQVLEGLHDNMISVGPAYPNEHHLRINEMFRPLNRVGLFANPYPSIESFQKFISQNFNNADFFAMCPVSLDEITLVNAKELQMIHLHDITVKDINRFLRLWQKGVNRRMAFLLVRMPAGVILEVGEVLKGTNYTVSSEKRQFERVINNSVVHVEKGKFDIWTKDGRLATIIFLITGEHHSVHMFVWD